MKLLLLLVGFLLYGTAEGTSRQSCPSVESLPLAFSFSLRGPSYGGSSSSRSSAGPSSHILTLQSHASSPMSSMLSGGGGLNPYSTPLPPHYNPSVMGAGAASNHTPSPPPFGCHGPAEPQEGSSSSPKFFPSKDVGPYGARTSLRYKSFQQQPHHHPSAPTYPPPPLPTTAPPSRFSSHFQSLNPVLVQAEAALWGEQRRGGDPADKKSRGELLQESGMTSSITNTQNSFLIDNTTTPAHPGCFF